MTRTTTRSRFLPSVVLVAFCSCAAWAAPPGTIAAPTTKVVTKRPVVLARQQLDFSRSPGFYEAYLAPGMSLAVRNEHAVTTGDYANAWMNHATQDPATAERVETRTIRELGNGVKRYAIERLEISGFTLPVFGGRNPDGAALPDDLPGVRLHLGFSSLAPRADVLIPVDAGRVVVSADARGRIATTLESPAFGFRIAASVDVPKRTAAVGLNLRF